MSGIAAKSPSATERVPRPPLKDRRKQGGKEERRKIRGGRENPQGDGKQ
jgi:hypothetical protein